MRYCYLLLLLSLPFFSLGQNEFSPCAQSQPVKVVVIGSSTAAGAGASTSDSSWVGRYRNYLQQVNADNEVVNLARGGYHTYKLMPDDFDYPAGRPAPDSARNITAAIAENPDAIIVNLPSNDVAIGFSVEEQLNNFDTIVAEAKTAGIPIWIATTQPRNFDTTKVNRQMEVRDSIWTKYGAFAIDFWTEIADSTGIIKAEYNSGDGVHLNDAGHAILFQRVREKLITEVVFEPADFPDYSILNIIDHNPILCRPEESTVDLVLMNSGQEKPTGYSVFLNVYRNDTFQSNATLSFETLPTCQIDTLPFTINTTLPGHYRLEALVFHPSDENPTGNERHYNFFSLGEPNPAIQNDTVCMGELAKLKAASLPEDQISWYVSPGDTNSIGSSEDFYIPNLQAETTFYATAFRPAHNIYDHLQTTDQHDVNWNGIMFDVVAHQDLSIDSLSLIVAQTGMQGVDVYVKDGTHRGFESDAAAWTRITADSVLVTGNSDFIPVPLPAYQLNQGDTVSFYLMMKNPGADLSYQRTQTATIHSNEDLTLITGTGSNFNFGGGLYFPREWNGIVHYHYESGSCQSAPKPATAVPSQPTVDLGSVTTLAIDDSFSLSAEGEFESYWWSTGAQTAEITIDSTLGADTSLIWVTVTDRFGCQASDTIRVVFEHPTGMTPISELTIQLYPNPNRGSFTLTGLQKISKANIAIFDESGRKISFRLEGKQIVLNKPQSKGIYILKITDENEVSSIPFLVME